jgi:hypothetical protein
MSPVEGPQGLGKLLIMGYFFVISLSTVGFFPQVSLTIGEKILNVPNTLPEWQACVTTHYAP